MATVLVSNQEPSFMEWLTAEFLLAAGTVLGIVGGGLKFVISRGDAKDDKLEKMLNERIDGLKREVDGYRAEIGQLRLENGRLIRHIGVLEGVMRASNLAVPTMEEPRAS